MIAAQLIHQRHAASIASGRMVTFKKGLPEADRLGTVVGRFADGRYRIRLADRRTVTAGSDDLVVQSEARRSGTSARR